MGFCFTNSGFTLRVQFYSSELCMLHCVMLRFPDVKILILYPHSKLKVFGICYMICVCSLTMLVSITWVSLQVYKGTSIFVHKHIFELQLPLTFLELLNTSIMKPFRYSGLQSEQYKEAKIFVYKKFACMRSQKRGLKWITELYC